MSVDLLFWYKRYERVPKHDDKTGEQIGVIIVEAEDCLNLYDVLRGYWHDQYTFRVIMKDAHEETREIELPPKVKRDMINQKKPIPKEKMWLVSQVDLIGEDIRRFKLATELALPTDRDLLPRVIAPHALSDGTTGPKTQAPVMSIVNSEGKQVAEAQETTMEEVESSQAATSPTSTV